MPGDRILASLGKALNQSFLLDLSPLLCKMGEGVEMGQLYSNTSLGSC